MSSKCVGCQQPFRASETTGQITVIIDFYGQPEALGGKLCSQACAVAAMRSWADGFADAIARHPDPTVPQS